VYIKYDSSNLPSSFNMFCSFSLLLTALVVFFKMLLTGSNGGSFDMELTDDSNANTTQLSQNDVISKVELTIYHQSPSIELVSAVSIDCRCNMSSIS
jgi:hypothetical protein